MLGLNCVFVPEKESFRNLPRASRGEKMKDLLSRHCEHLAEINFVAKVKICL